MKKLPNLQSRLLLCAAAGVLTMVLTVAGAKPAAAQASDAAEKCTPDVMRLCSEFVPDADRIVVCLKAKRRQLTPGCRDALASGGGSGGEAKPRHHRRLRHKEG